MTVDLLDFLVSHSVKRRSGSSDGRITALVVQGGGMRGVYSAAALLALEDAGLCDAFDHVVGSSAGAINGGYFLARQSRRAVSIYTDDISNRRFIDFLRWRPIVDIDFLVDEVFKKKKLLDVPALRSSTSMLHVVLTDYDRLEPFEITNRDDDIDIFEAFRATAALPLLFDRRVAIRGRGCIDGGVLESIALFRAIQLGCTDLVVVITRSVDFHHRAPNLLLRTLIRGICRLRGHSTTLTEHLVSEEQPLNEVMTYLNRHAGTYDQPRVYLVAPSDPGRLVQRTTIERNRLIDCARMAQNDGRRLLGLDPTSEDPM